MTVMVCPCGEYSLGKGPLIWAYPHGLADWPESLLPAACLVTLTYLPTAPPLCLSKPALWASCCQRDADKAFIEFMILIYDNSNPIIGSVLSTASSVTEFYYGQARFPLLEEPFPPILEVHPICLREFSGPGVGGTVEGKGRLPGLGVADRRSASRSWQLHCRMYGNAQGVTVRTAACGRAGAAVRNLHSCVGSPGAIQR